ncbi:MAG: hypothetical protein JNK95_14845 [Candidatus Competibacter sp.]|nr:hypothetical protein [Candidatus Competibacter sp.]MDG4607063.1 hypothetical protein [Candidatus Contendobacter sp.]HRD49056.1 hypothetical protein [Candidatus Contendobacter sp.]
MITFDHILDVVMELPDEQQEMLLDIVQHRRLETRRKEIAEMARESLTAFHAGELKPQPVEDIIEKLRLELQG